jgi:hypothetical protein
MTITVRSFLGDVDADVDFRAGKTGAEVDAAVVEPGAHGLCVSSVDISKSLGNFDFNPASTVPVYDEGLRYRVSDQTLKRRPKPERVHLRITPYSNLQKALLREYRFEAL